MFTFSFDDLFPSSSVTLVGYDTVAPIISGFDTSTLPDFGPVTSFNDSFQNITSTQMPSFTFAFDSNYMQMPSFEPIRNLVPNILVQQDQIKAINSDLINKIPVLQEQFNEYKSAYDANITLYNNAMATYNQYIRYRDITRPGSYLYNRMNYNINQKLIEANQYVQAINNASSQYEKSYTAYQTEAQRLKDSVDQYNNSVRDYEAKTKAVAEETQRQIQAEKERKELERKQEEDRLAAETRAEQERIAEQQRLEKIALEQKQQEDARLAEIKRQQDEAEQARIKAEEDARIKEEDEARLREIIDELKKEKTIDTPPTIVADLDKSKVTITQPDDLSNVPTTSTPTVIDTVEPSPTDTTETSPELPDLDTTPTPPVTTPTDQDLLDLVFPVVNPNLPTTTVTPPVTTPVTVPNAVDTTTTPVTTPVTTPTTTDTSTTTVPSTTDTSTTTVPTINTDQDILDIINRPKIPPTTDPTKPTTTPVTDPTAPVLPPVTPPITDPTVDPITVNPPPDDELPDDEVSVDEVPPVDEVPVDDKEKPPTKTVKDEPSVNVRILDIPNRRTLPTNRALASSLNLNTNVGTVLGTGLSTRPDISSTSEPYLLESDNKKRRDVWNTESLRGALGI